MNKIPSSDSDKYKLKTATNEVAFYIEGLIHVLCPVHGDTLFQVSLVLKQGLGIHLDGIHVPWEFQQAEVMKILKVVSDQDRVKFSIQQ